MRDFMSERSWYRHVRMFCWDFKKGQKMSDVCDICKHYDTRIFPKLGPMVREIRATLESLLPSYFRALDKEQSLVSENPHAVSNPLYLQRLLSYKRIHSGRSPAA